MAKQTKALTKLFQEKQAVKIQPWNQYCIT